MNCLNFLTKIFILVCHAVEQAHTSIFAQGGQACCVGSLTYVHEDIYEEFVQRSIKRAELRKLGDPFDLSIQQGPQARNPVLYIYTL